MPLTAAEQIRRLCETDVAELSPAEAKARRLLDVRLGVEPLADFIGRISNGKYPSPSHVAPIRRLFERAGRGEAVKAVISMPPRHGKTITIQHSFGWYLRNWPGTQNAYVSSGAEYANKRSEQIRDIALRAGVELTGTARNDWVTSSAGGLKAIGIGGQYVGIGTTGIQVIDDPYATPEDAQSPVIRAKVWDWYEGVAMNRVEPGGSRIVCHTRWHPDDLIGRLLREEPGEWEVINVPAVEDFSEEAYEAYRMGDGPIEAIGEPLWPAYYPLEELVPFMRNKHFWWALYMGSPRLRGQKLFGREVGRFDPKKFSITGCYAAIAVDPAATKKTSADHSAIVTGAIRGVGDEAILYVLDVQRLQVGIPELVRRLIAIQRRPTVCGRPLFSTPNKGLLVVVEAVAGFKSVPQMLLDIEPRLRVKEITPAQDKFLRAQPLADAWNDVATDPATGLKVSRVMIPDGAPWEADFLAEFDRFTGVDDDEDDQVDATAHLWNALHKPGVRRPRQERRTYEPAE